MDFGFMMLLSPRENIRRFADLAQQAEEVGFDMAWLGDSHLIAKDAPVALTLAAEATERIHIGTGVTNPVTRHYVTIANLFTGLQDVSGGRAVLGIGTGDSAVRTLGLRPATRAELRRSIARIRDLARGDELQIDGHPVRMLTARGDIPVFVAATQRKMLQLGGAVGDGVILMGGADSSVTKFQLRHVEEGAQAAGRSLDDVFIDLWFAISVSDDEPAARQDVRPWAVSQARFFSSWQELPDSLRRFEDEFKRSATKYDFYKHLSRHAEHSSEVSDDFVDVIAVSGPAEKCIRKIEPLLDLKIDRITFALLPGGRAERLQRLGEELVVKLRSRNSGADGR